MNPREEFYAAVRAVLEAIPREKGQCPLCKCEQGKRHAETCPLRRLHTMMAYGPKMPEVVEARRERILAIDRWRLTEMLRSGGSISIYCSSLPADADIVGVDTSEKPDDFERNEPIKLIVWSASFEAVLPHERPEIWGLRGYIHPPDEEELTND